ncbi:MAG: hypothetical protein WCA19_14045 [Candidatus Acidiferrales bacterium]
MTPEFPPAQPFGQSLSALEILSDQQNVPFSERHLAPPKHSAVVSGATVLIRSSPRLLQQNIMQDNRLIGAFLFLRKFPGMKFPCLFEFICVAAVLSWPGNI